MVGCVSSYFTINFFRTNKVPFVSRRSWPWNQSRLDVHEPLSNQKSHIVMTIFVGLGRSWVKSSDPKSAVGIHERKLMIRIMFLVTLPLRHSLPVGWSFSMPAVSLFFLKKKKHNSLLKGHGRVCLFRTNSLTTRSRGVIWILQTSEIKKDFVRRKWTGQKKFFFPPQFNYHLHNFNGNWIIRVFRKAKKITKTEMITIAIKCL